MTQQETAMKLASASATCKGDKCPFRGRCRGTSETCAMKEVAMMLRANMADIEKLELTLQAMGEIATSAQNYIVELEKNNKRYHDLISAFQHGYRPKEYIKKRRYVRRKPRVKKNPVDMDGDERYAVPVNPDAKPDPELVII